MLGLEQMTEQLRMLNEIHDKSWGKPWPTITCTIHRRDIFPNESDDTDGDEDMDSNNGDDDSDNFDHIPTEATFTCLLDVDLLRAAVGIIGKFSVIVIREEYKFLHELLGEKDRPFIVTGHPGTGKTVFLLYLLIYRLQHELPTAVEFSPNAYIVFSAGGVSVCPTKDLVDFDHWTMLPPGCWCLSDGNANVTQPCIPFQRDDLRTFLITSSGPNEYREWRTQAVANTVITALPRAVEPSRMFFIDRLRLIRDLLPHSKMHGWKPCDAVSIMRKWGPCTRTVSTILGDPDEEDSLWQYAMDAAIDIYNDPSKVSLRDVGRLPSGEGSTLLFILPIRSNDKSYYGNSRFIIPTMHLSEIFDKKCQDLSTQSRMELHELFSMHAMTRSPVERLHEKNMHLQMMNMASKYYEIFNDNVKYHMISTVVVPVGTASGLRDATRKTPPSFYWFPSFVDWPGIDGVLVNDNDIYALQATITDTHRWPREGLKKIWQTIGADVAKLFAWHFVVITNNKPLADKHAMDLGTQLHDVVLGRRPHVKVSAWVCVLKSDV